MSNGNNNFTSSHHTQKKLPSSTSFYENCNWLNENIEKVIKCREKKL